MTDTTARRRPAPQPAERRAFLRNAGTASLSLTAIAMLSGCETWDSMLDTPPPQRQQQQAQAAAAQPPAPQNSANDVALMNAGLALEHQANAAYQVAIDGRQLRRNLVPAAQLFQSHHREQREGLIATIRAFGGTPVGERTAQEYAATFNLPNLRTQQDVLRLLAGIERNAANAYIGMVENFQDRRLARIASRLAADDVMHWTALAGLMQEQLPASAMSFGA